MSHHKDSKASNGSADRNNTVWGSIPASRMARKTDNPIRKIVDGLKLTPNPEKEMISLSIGDPTAFGNLPLSEVIKDAVTSAIRSNRFNGYSPSVGFEESRSAVAEYHSLPEAPLTSKDVILTNGCSSALDMAISALADPGQHILIPRPGFSLYQTLALSLGINVKYYDLIPERSWEVDLDHLESLIDGDTACIIVNNPSNPCGSVYTASHIRSILEVAQRNRVPVIADEVYADFVFSTHCYVSMASQSSTVPILSCGGLTKKYLVPGWRLGWILIHDRFNAFETEVRPGLTNLSQRILGPNTLVQGSLRTILNATPKEYFDKSLTLVQRNAEICYTFMTKIKGLNPIMSSGAMYMMIAIQMENFPEFKTDLEFTQQLVTEQSVFCLPGKCFQYPNYFRVVLTVPEEKILEACDRISEFCRDHYTPSDIII